MSSPATLNVKNDAESDVENDFFNDSDLLQNLMASAMLSNQLSNHYIYSNPADKTFDWLPTWICTDSQTGLLICTMSLRQQKSIPDDTM